MERFLQRHSDQIIGVLSGFDRVVFRGTLRSLSYLQGMDKFLGSQRVLYKEKCREASVRLLVGSQSQRQDIRRFYLACDLCALCASVVNL